MNSKMRPLWLVFNDQDAVGQKISMIFKNGDGELLVCFMALGELAGVKSGEKTTCEIENYAYIQIIGARRKENVQLILRSSSSRKKHKRKV